MLIAFEGLNGVGKTTYINALIKLMMDQGIAVNMTSSKPTEDEMRAEGVYDIFTNQSLEDISSRKKLALSFYKRQINLKDQLNDSSNIFVTDRWISSTVVYTVYRSVLDNPELTQKVKDYYNIITSGEELDIGLLMEVNAALKNEFKRLISYLVLSTGSKPIYPDSIVFINNPEAKKYRDARQDKLVSRYERENIDDILFVLYDVYHNYLVNEYNINVIKLDVQFDTNNIEESVKSVTDVIYNKIFQRDEEVNENETFQETTETKEKTMENYLPSDHGGREMDQVSNEEEKEREEPVELEKKEEEDEGQDVPEKVEDEGSQDMGSGDNGDLEDQQSGEQKVTDVPNRDVPGEDVPENISSDAEDQQGPQNDEGPKTIGGIQEPFEKFYKPEVLQQMSQQPYGKKKDEIKIGTKYGHRRV